MGDSLSAIRDQEREEWQDKKIEAQRRLEASKQASERILQGEGTIGDAALCKEYIQQLQQEYSKLYDENLKFRSFFANLRGVLRSTEISNPYTKKL